MYRITVLFGHPQDPAAFERYYRQTHFPLTAKVKGIKGVTIGKLEALDPGQPAPYYRITSFYFDSREACEAVLASPEGQATLADLNNFATGGVSIVANEEEVLVPVSLPPTPQDWKHHLVQDHFGAAAQAYTTSKVHASGPDLAWIVEAAALTGKEHVVDVGTGTGHTALALAPYATEVVALDITLPMLEEARHLAASRGVTNVHFLQGDACALPLNSSQFDLVACRYAAHHFTHVAKAIGEWARILKTGGKVVVADSVSPEEPEIDRFLNEIEVLRDPSHGRNYRISEWLSLLAEAGFTASLVRSWSIPLDLPSWTQRIQAPPASVAQIERLFADAPSLTRERLHIGLNEEGLLSFALPAAMIVGIKPV